MKKPDSPLSVAEILRIKAEEQLEMRNKAAGKQSSDEADIRKLTHELQVHQIELEMQKEELVIAKEKAEFAEEKYTELYDFAPSGYILLTKEGTIEELNFAAARMLGKERLHLVRSQFDTFVSVNTRRVFDAFVQRVFISNEKQSCEVTIATERNPHNYIQIDGIVSQNNGFCLLTLIDITEKNQNELNLRESEEKFRMLVNLSPAGIYMTDKDGKCTYVNEAWCKMAGMKPEEAYGDGWINAIHPNDREHIFNIWSIYVNTGEEWSWNYRFLDKNGKVTWVYGLSKPILDSEGKTTGFLGTNTDISQLKLTEEKLRESEEKNKAIVLNTPDHIVIHDKDLKYTFVANPQLGLTEQDMLGKTDYDFLSRSDADKLMSVKSRVMVTKEPFHLETSLISGSGKEEFFDGDLIPTFDENKEVNGLIGYFRNVTERKLLEEKIKQLEQKSKAWLENSPACTKVVDLDFNLQFMSTAGIKGLKIDDITPYYGKPYPFHFYPESFKTKMTGNMIRAKKTGKVITQEAPVVDINGNEVWFHSTIVPVKDQSDRVEYLLIVSLDTTEQKQAEEALRKSHDLLDTTFASLNDAVFILNDKSLIVESNQSASRIFGYSHDEMQGQSTTFIHVDETSLEEFRKHLHPAIKANGRLDHFEFRMKRRDGTIFDTEHSVTQLADFQGRLSGWVSVVRDITERKRVEKTLIESEEKYRLLSEQSGLGIGLYSTDGTILFYNRRALLYLGGNLEDFVGKSVIEVYGEEVGTKYLNRLMEGLRLERTLIFEDCMESPTGKYWFSTSNSIIRNSSGEVIGIQSVSDEISERILFEEKLTKSADELRALSRHLIEVREEERTIIARDLHDDLGQKLTAMNMDISWLKSRIGVQSRSVENKIQQLVTLMNDTIDSVQKISYGLRPSILDDLGLCPAIEWQVTDFHKNTGISCSISCSPNEIVVDAGTSLAVFRIVQEALTNIARHSGATRVNIKIKLTDESLEVLIKDNGSGITPGKIESSKSFGLIGMRERVRSVGGEVNITGRKGEGTRVEVVIPVGK